MSLELKKSFEMNKVFFGIKESLKKSHELNKVLVTSDCRMETRDLLSGKKINFDLMELTSEEIATQLELDFACEVFGLKK